MSPDVSAARYILKKLCNHDNLSWPGPCFNINLIKRLFCKISQSLEAARFVFRIVQNCTINLKFDRHIGSTAPDMPVKFQSDATIYTTNLAAPRLHEILRRLLIGYWKGPRAELHAQTRNTLHSASHEACCKSCVGDMEEYHSRITF